MQDFNNYKNEMLHYSKTCKVNPFKYKIEPKCLTKNTKRYFGDKYKQYLPLIAKFVQASVTALTYRNENEVTIAVSGVAQNSNRSTSNTHNTHNTTSDDNSSRYVSTSNDYDRELYFLSSDTKICIGRVKAKSIGIATINVKNNNWDNEHKYSAEFAWSDYVKTGEIGFALHDILQNMTDDEKRTLAIFLTPNINLKQYGDIDILLGLYLTYATKTSLDSDASSNNHKVNYGLLELKIGHTCKEFFAFDEHDVIWNLELPKMFDNSNFANFIDKSLNFIETGEHFDTEKDSVFGVHPIDVKICNYCKLSETELQSKLFVCSLCKKARYCNSKCQTQDWPQHKILCHKPN